MFILYSVPFLTSNKEHEIKLRDWFLFCLIMLMANIEIALLLKCLLFICILFRCLLFRSCCAQQFKKT